MRGATQWAAALLAVPVLSGCLGSDEDLGESGTPPVEALDPTTQWVLGAAGEVLPAADFGPELPAFSVLKVVDRVSGEPTLGVTRTGAVFYASIDWDSLFPPPPLGGGAPRTFYMRSTDGGATWENKSPHLMGQETHYDSADPYVYVDPTTGRVWAVDMGPSIVCNKVSWSDDDGESWMTRAYACNTTPNDHPTIFAGPHPAGGTPLYPNQAYLCTNQVYDSVCYVSPDGGLTWTQTTPAFVGVNTAGELCGGLTGHGHASFATGTVYLGRDYCGVPAVAVSDTFGATWDVVTISEDPKHQPSGHDVSIGTDTAGNAYASWIGDEGRSVYYSASTDQGRSWSTPINVTAPGVNALKLPSLVAGSEGRVAFQYIGAAAPMGWSTFEMEEGCDDQRDPKCFLHPAEARNATWNAYVGITLNGAEAAPVFAITVANPLDEPIKRGQCAGRCYGDAGPADGGMYDFFDIDIDPTTGVIYSAVVDVCNEGCDGAQYDAFTATEHSVGAVTRLDAGPRLLTEPIAEASFAMDGQRGPVGLFDVDH